MDSNLLTRVMALAEKTGDKMIVVNPETGKAFAVLPFDAYEKIVEGIPTARLTDLESENQPETPEIKEKMSREEIVDKINKEISDWNSAQQSQKETEGISGMDILDDEANEDEYYLEPIE